MIIQSHESRLQATERILSGLGEHRAAIDAHLGQLSKTLGSQVTELGGKVDLLGARVDELTRSLGVVEEERLARKARAERIRKGALGGLATVALGGLTALGTWLFGWLKGAMR